MVLSPLAQLAPEVADYSVGPFLLREDLERLDAVNRAAAPEAVILYCSRILETSAGDALRKIGQSPSPNIFSNLQVLEHLNQIGDATRYWAHALRRLGNSARHVFSRVGPREAHLSILFAEGWLDWFFCRFPHGRKLRSLTRSGEPLRLTDDESSRRIIRSVEALEPSASTATAAQRPWQSPEFFETPVFSALAADVLLRRDDAETASRLLAEGLACFPADVRLLQLKGLYLSRQQKLAEALDVLVPLYDRIPDDDETGGILAGTYKRRWQRDRTDTPALEKSCRIYRDGWKRSGRKSAYLGINAATTALWLGRREESRRLAGEVENLLHRRAAALPPELADPTLDFNFWDRVTLAEALLLLGDYSAANEIYQDAFTRNPHRTGDVAVCRRQRDEILKVLGRPHGAT